MILGGAANVGHPPSGTCGVSVAFRGSKAKHPLNQTRVEWGTLRIRTAARLYCSNWTALVWATRPGRRWCRILTSWDHRQQNALRKVRYAFVAGVLSLILLGCNRVSQTEELQRKTSPDRMVDAVLIREAYGGAVGGFEWKVLLVARGTDIGRERQKPVLVADTLTGGELHWVQGHLLEVSYDRATINLFKNLWCSDSLQQHPRSLYCTEVRLHPIASFSVLAPDGSFRN
jgi:hypothetical protein